MLALNLAHFRRVSGIANLQILVLGGGPGGAATAIGLGRLGYGVKLISSARTFAACEGISARTLAGLRNAGCQQAAASVVAPSPRVASWNGSTNQYNTEQLVYRPDFDTALIRDMQDSGVDVFSGVVQTIDELEQGWRVSVADGNQGQTVFEADFLVEARGRSTPLKAKNKVRGPETVSLLQRWQLSEVTQQAKSMALSFRHGWAWLAQFGNQLYTQITVAATDPRLPKKARLKEFLLAELASLPSTQSWIEGAVAVADTVARSSTSILAGDLVKRRYLRVGDAALAVDPLSGNGIFQALSSGLVAPAVINTLIRYPQRISLATEFYQQRCQHAFLRFARIGRDFYAQEQRWVDEPFWQERNRWPDLKSAHGDDDLSRIQILGRPVVMNNEILSKPVVVMPSQPLGVWQVAGIEIASIFEWLNENPSGNSEQIRAQLESSQQYGEHQITALIGWMLEQQLLKERPD